MRKVNWSFKIYIPYAGVRPKLKGLKAGQSTLCRTVTFRLLLPVHLTSRSLIPVLDETVNSNLPTISIKSTQNIMKLFLLRILWNILKRGNSLGYFTTQASNEQKSLSKRRAIKKDEQSTLALQGSLI